VLVALNAELDRGIAMKPANFAPIYLGLYPPLAEVARKHGYALAAHGTLGRDFDLICVPWVDNPSEPQAVVNEIMNEFDIKQVGQPQEMSHKRICYTLKVSFGECFLDFSFMPKIAV